MLDRHSFLYNRNAFTPSEDGMKKLLLVLILLCTSAGALSANTYPSRPLKMILPFAPGGIVDLVGRALAERLETELGQPVIVENRTGAGSQVGISAAASSDPDGYTILLVDPSVVVNPSMRANSPYQLSQLKALATLTTAPLMVVVHPDLPVHNLKELIALSNSRSGGLTYASPGKGTTPHLAPELLKVQSGFNATQVPYRGGGPSIPDLLSGRVDAAFYSSATVLPLIESGGLRAIAQTGNRRSDTSSSVPTAVESGYPDFIVELWTSLLVPVGVPDDVEARLVEAIEKAAHSEQFIIAIKKSGLDLFFNQPAKAQEFVAAEQRRWDALIKAAKITAD
jgi:tripartite-type tricarboxylate transporter receptor subunit TctC